MSKDLFKYYIGTIETNEKHMQIVEYHSRSNLLVQAQLMEIQFPTLGVIEEFLNDFDVDEKLSIFYRSLSHTLPLSSDGIFLFSKTNNQWNILDQSISSKLIGIYKESPDFEDIVEHICSCTVKNNPKLQNTYADQSTPVKMIFASYGFERYCNHCHSYVLISNFYRDHGGKSFESVCKSCYIPHFKPYKLAKKYKPQIVNSGV